MNSLETAIAWTLLHSLWIAAATWLLVSLLQLFFHSPEKLKTIRLGGLFLFLITICVAAFTELSQDTPAEVLLSENSSLAIISTPGWPDTLRQAINSNSTLVSLLWGIGILSGILRFLYHRNKLRQCEAAAIPCSEDKIMTQLNSIRKGFGIQRKVQLKISALIDSPMTAGVFRPIIYFPIGLTSGFSFQEIDAILRHELAHIQSHDYLVNLLLVLLETVFFFNPLLLLLIRDMRREMEYACDDLVLKTHDPVAYARSLVKLQENTLSNQVALAAQNNNSAFKNRIERMIYPNKPKVNPQFGMVLLLLTALVVSSAFVSHTSTPEPINPAISLQQEQEKQDTIRVKNKAELDAKLEEMGFDELSQHVVLMNDKRLKFVRSIEVMKKSDEMMVEIQKELINDGILNENKQKVMLMFQYSDVLNGEKALGEHYEKYKGILNRYFPVYDSFATTRIFRYKKP